MLAIRNDVTMSYLSKRLREVDDLGLLKVLASEAADQLESLDARVADLEGALRLAVSALEKAVGVDE